MKVGKLPEQVLARSVLKEIGHRRGEVLMGPGIGQDCAVLSLKPDEVFVMSTDPITGTVKDMGSHSIHITANDLAASGAEPVGVMLTILLPQETEEHALRRMMQDVERTCRILDMEVLGGHTEVTNVVNQPLISVTGVGKVKKGQTILTNGLKPGHDLVVTKWIALEGTSIIAKEKEEELKRVLPEDFVNTAKAFDQYLSVIPESRIAAAHGASARHDITEGGIFGALWEMGAASGVGISAELLKIPIRQETIEVCEVFDINPYRMMSSGSLLIGCPNGNFMVRELEKEGIPAAVIGRATETNDRVIENTNETRFLEPAGSDELYKIYQ